MRHHSCIIGVLLTASSVALWTAGCDVPKTLTPDVEITTSLPLFDETIEIGERVAKADSVRIDPTDERRFDLAFKRDKVNLGDNGNIGGDRMAVDNQLEQSFTGSVGRIKLDDQPPTSTPAVTLGELLPEVRTLPPNDLPYNVPQTQLPTSSEQVTFGNLQRVTFLNSSSPDTNRVVISFANHLPLPLGPVEVFLSTTGDTAGISAASPGVIGSTTISVIAPNDSVVADPIDLSGKTLESPAYVITRAQLQGGQTTTAELIPAYFVVTVDVSALAVESANAKIPRQSFTTDKGISFANQKLQLINVDLAHFSTVDTNRFELSIINALPTDVVVRYSLPDLSIPLPPLVGAGLLSDVRTGEGGGSDYGEASLDIGAKGRGDIIFDLNGASLSNSTAPGEPIDRLQIGITTTIKGTDDFVDINARDSVRVDAHMTALAIERVDGRVPPGDSIRVAIEPFSFPLEQSVPAGLQGFHAQEILVKLRTKAFDAEVTAEANIKLTVFGEDDVTPITSYRRVIAEKIEPGTVVPFVITQDSLGEDGHSPLDVVNATLDNVFARGRSLLGISGEIVVRDRVTLVRDLSRLLVTDVSVTSPLKFSIPAITFDGTESDTGPGYEVNLDNSAKDDFVPRAKSIVLVADIENHFPVGGTLVMFASSDSNFTALRTQFPAAAKRPVNEIPDVLSVPAGSLTGSVADLVGDEAGAVRQKAVFKLFTINMPEPTRRADGTVDDANPGRGEVTVPLTDEIQLFGYDTLYLLPRVQLLNDPGIVQLTPQDYVKVSAWTQLTGTTKR